MADDKSDPKNKLDEGDNWHRLAHDCSVCIQHQNISESKEPNQESIDSSQTQAEEVTDIQLIGTEPMSRKSR